MLTVIPALIAGMLSAVSCNQRGPSCELGYDPDAQQLYIGDTIAVASTQNGKVRGYILRNVYTFLGIQYAAPASGENRFMPPQPVEPWDDVRPAVFYGNVAPQITDNKYSNSYQTFSDHWNYYDVSENCLTLNVWTPKLDDAKRPVLVWIHGGGFTSGNGIEQDSYNGENLSRAGDIVFVSLNHRLGPIGFTDFSGVDPRFADSGNVGILDIVAALKWVNANISAFGGDPDNVTIMGQSGGGAKVCTLVAMAETQGLVSKAVALSGNITGAIDSNFSQELGKYIYRKGGSDMSKLQSMPWREYIDLANAAAAEYMAEHPNGMMRGAFGPVGDGFHIPMGTFYSDNNSPSSRIPMLFCTTTCEFSMSKTNPELEEIDKEGAVKMIAMMRSVDETKAQTIYDEYSNVLPDLKPIDVIGLVQSSRERVLAAADAKAGQEAPVYLAWFGFNPPIFDGRMRATHCSDIAYWFRNTDLMLTHTGGGAVPRALSERMSNALLSFMRTGSPSTESLPDWPEYTPGGKTMFLGEECKVLDNPDGEALASLK